MFTEGLLSKNTWKWRKETGITSLTHCLSLSCWRRGVVLRTVWKLLLRSSLVQFPLCGCQSPQQRDYCRWPCKGLLHCSDVCPLWQNIIQRSWTLSPIHHRQIWSFKSSSTAAAERGRRRRECLWETSSWHKTESSGGSLPCPAGESGRACQRQQYSVNVANLRTNGGGVQSCLDLFMRKFEIPFGNLQKYLNVWGSEPEAEVLLEWVGWEDNTFGSVLLIPLSWSWRSLEARRRLTYRRKLPFYYQSAHLYFCTYIFTYCTNTRNIVHIIISGNDIPLS